MQCCIVDDHCDIVPFVHAYYRAHKIHPLTKVVLVHFDAHPDLSLLSSSAHANSTSSWNEPEKLYDILSDEGGIAEFILPLVATKLISEVIWVRSEWCDQLPDGEVSFLLQDSVQTDPLLGPLNNPLSEPQPSVQVTYNTAYYLDEGVVTCEQCLLSDKSGHNSNEGHAITTPSTTVHLITTTATSESSLPSLTLNPTTGLFTTQPASLTVTTSNDLSAHIHNQSSNRQPTTAKPETTEWILDICLDYFTTINPFLEEISASITADLTALLVNGANVDIKGNLRTIMNDFACALQPQDASVSTDTVAVPTCCPLNIPSIVSTFVEIIKCAYRYLAFRHNPEDGLTIDGLLKLSPELMHSLQSSPSPMPTTNKRRKTNHSTVAVNNNISTHGNEQELCHCVKNKLARSITLKILADITSTHKNAVKTPTAHTSNNSQDNPLTALYSPKYTHFAALYLQILPYLSTKSQDLIIKNGFLVLLPHHTSTTEEIDKLVSNMVAFIKCKIMSAAASNCSVANSVRNRMTSDKSEVRLNRRPLFVTIARSSDDNYISADQVDVVQHKVLCAVNRLFGGACDGDGAISSGSCNISVTTSGFAGCAVLSSNNRQYSHLIIHDATENARDKCRDLWRKKLHLISDPVPSVVKK